MKAGTPGSYYETCCVSPHKGQGPNFEEKRDLNEEGAERRRRRDSDDDNNNGNNIGIDARNGGSGGVLRNFALNQ